MQTIASRTSNVCYDPIALEIEISFHSALTISTTVGRNASPITRGSA